MLAAARRSDASADSPALPFVPSMQNEGGEDPEERPGLTVHEEDPASGTATGHGHRNSQPSPSPGDLMVNISSDSSGVKQGLSASTTGMEEGAC